MLKNVFIAGFALALSSSTFAGAQETQTGAPAQQPTSSVYNRMRRVPGPGRGDNQQQTTQQSQQFPNPAQQFPPEQGMPGQRAPMTFPHAAGPPQAQPAQSSPSPSIQAPVQQPPATPYGLALQPPNPPRIGFADGQLTVNADNSSLSDILNEVSRFTGARIEGSHPDSERVFGQFGPGKPRDVLNSLLSGSRYDYILAGAIDDPGNVQQIMLTPHGSSMAATASNSKEPESQPAQPEEEEANEPVLAPQPIPEPIQPPVQVINSNEQGQQNQPQVKTPEQLLQELQRLRQQQQQQQSNPR